LAIDHRGQLVEHAAQLDAEELGFPTAFVSRKGMAGKSASCPTRALLPLAYMRMRPAGLNRCRQVEA